MPVSPPTTVTDTDPVVGMLVCSTLLSLFGASYVINVASVPTSAVTVEVTAISLPTPMLVLYKIAVSDVHPNASTAVTPMRPIADMLGRPKFSPRIVTLEAPVVTTLVGLLAVTSAVSNVTAATMVPVCDAADDISPRPPSDPRLALQTTADPDAHFDVIVDVPLMRLRVVPRPISDIPISVTLVAPDSGPFVATTIETAGASNDKSACALPARLLPVTATIMLALDPCDTLAAMELSDTHDERAPADPPIRMRADTSLRPPSDPTIVTLIPAVDGAFVCVIDSGWGAS